MRVILVLSLLVLGGCEVFPAKSDKLEDGVYRLSATGNVFASKESLQAKIDARASRLCGGDDSYEYIDEPKIKSFEQETGSNGATATGSYQFYTRSAKCKN